MKGRSFLKLEDLSGGVGENPEGEVEEALPAGTRKTRLPPRSISGRITMSMFDPGMVPVSK